MKFKVNKMAKITEASIEIKPLTVFIGKNGTNKSYMAHLVYELYKEISTLKDNRFQGRSKLAQDIITGYLNKQITDISLFDNFIIQEKEIIEQHQTGEDEYETEIHTEYTYGIKKIKEYNVDLFQDIYKYVNTVLLIKINKSYNTKNKTVDEIIFDIDVNSIFEKIDIKVHSFNREEAHIAFIRTLMVRIFTYLTKNLNAHEHFYFPSSRTGFVLAFDEIVSGVFRDRFGGQPTATKLTEPTIDFLSNFAEIKTGKFRDDNDQMYYIPRQTTEPKIIKELIKYLETNILQGEILEDTNSDDYTQYVLKTNMGKKLDLHVTSSATIELLPLIVFLKHFTKIKDRLLVIEEPEAHLHPYAQVLMARFIVMLINNGAKVLITTHSDYMLDELNNCISLYNTKPEIIKEHKLDDDMGVKIYLNEDDINVYLFKEKTGNIVEVKKLEIDEDGIPSDNFDDVKNELKKRHNILKNNTKLY